MSDKETVTEFGEAVKNLLGLVISHGMAGVSARDRLKAADDVNALWPRVYAILDKAVQE